jgi:hypothetical protein
MQAVPKASLEPLRRTRRDKTRSGGLEIGLEPNPLSRDFQVSAARIQDETYETHH